LPHPFRMPPVRYYVHYGAEATPEYDIGHGSCIFRRGAGSMCRYWWSGLVAEHFGETFPFGTLVVNVVGSTIIGLSAGLIMHVSNSGIATALQQLLMVGICGGLTTFSSFSLQTYNLFTEDRWLSALSNIAFSTGLSFGCVAVGWQITQGISF
jgi:fluoride exporter